MGKITLDQNQILLTGLFSVLMAYVTSFGICSILGFFISPLHNFIPFLLLGLGVDDMFVIVQAFKQLEPAKGCLISERFPLLSCSRHRTTKFPNSESPIFTTKFLF